MEYIEREAAIAYAISGRVRTLPTTENGENWIRQEEVRENLKAVPAAEVVPIVRGKWIKMTGMMPPEYHGHYECSLCGWHGDRRTREREYNFCPNCGAKME